MSKAAKTKQDLNVLFSNKDTVTFFVPLDIDFDNQEYFIVELLDCIFSHLRPLNYGLYAHDIIDFYNSKFNDIIDYLIYKRYVCTESDFVELAKNYISNIENELVQATVKCASENDLDTLNDKIRLFVKSILANNPIYENDINSRKGYINFDLMVFIPSESCSTEDE